MSIRQRLTVTFGVLLALVMVGFSLFVFTAVAKALSDEMDRRLLVRADQVRLALWPGGEVLGNARVVSAMRAFDAAAPGTLVEVYDSQGEQLAASVNLGGAHLPTKAPVPTIQTPAPVLSDGEVSDGMPVRVLVQRLVGDGGAPVWLVIGQNRQSLLDTLIQLEWMLAGLLVPMLAIAGAATWIITKHGLQPLTSISNQAEAIARDGDFTTPITTASKDEVGQLAGVVNQLLRTVEDTLRIHREFVADTSHELRNPLLALQSNLELLQFVQAPDDREECLREARQQVERMTRLITDLLLLARSEGHQILELNPVTLRPVLEKIAHEAGRMGGPAVMVEEGDDLRVTADEGRLEQLLWNLVDNARKHTPAHGQVTLRLTSSHGGARVAVEDNGCGIAPQDLPHIFDRFYRPKGAGAEGTGLGLAIARHLAEAHGGLLKVHSQPGAGSCFVLWLPDARPVARPAAALGATR